MKCTVLWALGALAGGVAFHFTLPSPHVLALYGGNLMSGFKRILDTSVLFHCWERLCAVCSLNLHNFLVFCWKAKSAQGRFGNNLQWQTVIRWIQFPDTKASLVSFIVSSPPGNKLYQQNALILMLVTSLKTSAVVRRNCSPTLAKRSNVAPLPCFLEMYLDPAAIFLSLFFVLALSPSPPS